MWKCVHRGLRTSANLLKNDQSNGGCIVSSIINKDIDEIPSQSNDRSKCSHSDERFKRPIKRERKIHTNQQPLARDSRTNCSSVHSQIGDTITVSPKSSSFVPTNSQSKTRTTNADQIVVVHEWEKASSSNLVSCRKCRQVYEGPKCLCFSEIRNRSWLSRKLRVKNPYAHSSSTSVRQEALQRSASNPFLPTQHLCTHPSLVENKLTNHSLITQKLNSSLKFRDTASPTSFFQPYHTCKESKSDLERGHTLSPKGSQACQKFSYCLLKLPFLSYNYMRTKGFNQFYACWPDKSKNEFGGDDNKRQDSKDKRESEEAKNDSWRRFQTQSLLEAIGLSSALLLGWFLAQCRVWRLCGEGHNSDHKRKLQKKRCMLGRLLFPRKNNSHKILNAVPSDKHESNGLDKEEKGPLENESRIALDNCNGESEGYFSELFKLDELQEKRSLNNFKSYLLNKEISSEAKRNLQKKVVHPGEEINGKSAIPMPWHTQQSKEYGPITFEEAFDEAGKSLEEAQAEILLLLALEKLEEEESDVGASAVELLNSAAHLGNSAAAFNLGICYEMGVGGVKKDLSQAYHWYKIASDNGHAAAMYNIAVFHAQGLAGLNVNTKLAHQLLEKASSLGIPEAADALTLLTSLKQTENPDVLKNDPVQEHNRHFSRSSLKDEEFEMSFSSNDYDLASKDIGHSMKPKSSLYKKSKDAPSTFSHVMESFSLVSPKLNENDSLCADLVLDNALSVKQSDFDYVATITFAQ